MSAPMCGYKVPLPFRDSRYCLNPAKWLVWFTTPDDGAAMRKRTCVHRCYWHRSEKFLPKGATQVVTESLASRAVDGAEKRETT